MDNSFKNRQQTKGKQNKTKQKQNKTKQNKNQKTKQNKTKTKTKTKKTESKYVGESNLELYHIIHAQLTDSANVQIMRSFIWDVTIVLFVHNLM